MDEVVVDMEVKEVSGYMVMEMAIQKEEAVFVTVKVEDVRVER